MREENERMAGELVVGKLVIARPMRWKLNTRYYAYSAGELVLLIFGSALFGASLAALLLLVG